MDSYRFTLLLVLIILLKSIYVYFFSGSTVPTRSKSYLKPCQSIVHNMMRCYQMDLFQGFTHPSNTHHNILVNIILAQMRHRAITFHGNIVKQTLCSQMNTMGREEIHLSKPRKGMTGKHLLSRSAPWYCRYSCHFFWPVLGQSQLGSSWRWFR